MTGKAIEILRFRGLVIRLDTSWLLIAPLMIWSLATGFFPIVSPDAKAISHIVLASITALGVLASLILHEVAHAAVARRYGQSYPPVLLYLFGGVAEHRPQSSTARAEVLTAMAGPAASLFLALVCAVDAWLADLAGLSDPMLQGLAALASVNLGIALLNLLPAVPLDGGRVLFACLLAKTRDLSLTAYRATMVSAVIAFTFIAAGLATLFAGHAIAGLWLVVIGLSLRATAPAALAQVETERGAQLPKVGDLMTRNPLTATPDQTLSQLVNQLFLARGVSFVPVLEDGVLLGYIDMHMVAKIDREHWTTTTVDDVIESTASENTVSPELAGADLITLMLRTGRRKFLVTDGGRLVGLITLGDVLSLLQGLVAAPVRSHQERGVHAQNLRYIQPSRQ